MVSDHKIIRDQLPSHDPSRYEEEHEQNNKKITVHKLVTPLELTGSPENKAPPETKSVTNLYEKNESPDSKIYSNVLTQSVKPTIQSRLSPILEEEGQSLIDGLLREGIKVNLGDSGPSSDGKRFKIAVSKPNSQEDLKRITEKMSAIGFIPANKGDFGTLFFDRPLSQESNIVNRPDGHGDLNENRGTKIFERDATEYMVFKEDFRAAYYDKDLYFHKGDLAAVPPEWVRILEKKGAARRVDIL